MTDRLKQAAEFSKQAVLLRDIALKGESWAERAAPAVSDVQSREVALTTALFKAANRAANAAQILVNPLTVGVFGASQAGKSYLVNTLSAGGESLTTTWSGHKISFMQHVNPTGGDHEATGVVTRFTHSEVKPLEAGGKSFPIRLKVFRICDIVMLLVNSFNSDLDIAESDQAKINSKISEENLQKILDTAENNSEFALPEGSLPLVTAADTVDMAEYVKGKSLKTAFSSFGPDSAYWLRVRALAPRLNVRGLKAVFEVLWDGMAAFSLIFEKVASNLEKLKGCGTVYSGIDAFVKDDGTGSLVQLNNTVNSIGTVLKLFDRLPDLELGFVPEGGEPQTASLNLAAVAASTLEMTFPLAESSGIGDFDILDFPGARSRHADPIRSFWEDEQKNADSISRGAPTEYIKKNGLEFLRRGKVGYMFERYTADRAVDVLLFCINSSAQNEVTSLGPILDSWISKNVGDAPQIRAKHERIPLIGVLTRFDQTLSKDLKREAGAPSHSGEVITLALETYKSQPWLKNWKNGEPFAQFFMVRRPGLADDLFETKDHVESGFTSEISGRSTEQSVKEYGESLLGDEMSVHLYGAPGQAFADMLKLNDGGAGAIKDFIAKNFSDFDESRLSLIGEVRELASQSLGALCVYQGAGRSKIKAARESAAAIARGIWQCDLVASLFGTIRHECEIEDASLERKYLAGYTKGENAGRFAQMCIDSVNERLADLSGGAGYCVLFAALSKAWFAGRDNLTAEKKDGQSVAAEKYSFFCNEDGSFVKDEAQLDAKFRPLMAAFTDALDKSVRSCALQRALEDELGKNELLGQAQSLMARIQAQTAQRLISGFFTYLGFDSPEQKGAVQFKRSDFFGKGADDERPLFEEKREFAQERGIEAKNPVETLPLVTREFTVNCGRHYLADYLTALGSLICGRNVNVGGKYRIPEDLQHELDYDILDPYSGIAEECGRVLGGRQ